MDNPLRGKTILVPRSKKQAIPLTEKIEELGGISVTIPLIEMKERKIAEHQINSLVQSSVDWLVFTSSNGVHAFFRQWIELDHRSLPVKIAVIGRKTMNTLAAYGYSADFVPTQFVAEQFVKEFKPLIKKKDHILLIKGNLARDYIAVELAKATNHVEEALVYETYFPQESGRLLAEKLANKELDILFFTSSSTVNHFMKTVEEHQLINEIRDCLIVSIGPITTQTLINYHFHVDVTAKQYTVECMISDLIKYLTNRKGETNDDRI
ncbi:MAG TPA: uroporphyrinogen-III synthase [Niallia sp.]|nr:uroporphyrinogen-III synthase [Niallia sp.]